MKDNQLKLYFRFLSFFKPFLPQLIVGLIFYTSEGITYTYMLSVFQIQIIDSITTGTAGNLLPIILRLLISASVFLTISCTGLYILFYCISKVDCYIKGEILHSISSQKKPIEHSADYITKFTNDTSLMLSLMWNTSSLLRMLVGGFGGVLLLSMIDWRLMVIAIIIGIISLLAQTVCAKYLKPIAKHIQADANNVHRRFMDIIDGAVVIRMFNISELKMKQFTDEANTLYNSWIISNKINTFRLGFASIEKWVESVGMIGIGFLFMTKWELSISELIIIPMLTQPIITCLTSFGNFVANIQPGLAGARRVYEAIDEPSENLKEDYPNLELYDEKAVLKIENVHYSYEKEYPILNGINLEANSGEFIGIVGASGSGKTTLLKLLLGIISPDEGHITICNQDIENVSLNSRRAQFAYVSQETLLFDDTLQQNIFVGKMDSLDSEINQAAYDAGLNSFIENIGGLNQPVGEKGSKLSGGQRQRIAIARALVRKAPILLLDEATSALDAETEFQILDTFINMPKRPIILFITHRLSAIKNADKICVLDNGCIKETGTHSDLIKQGGIYARLWSAQKPTDSLKMSKLVNLQG